MIPRQSLAAEVRQFPLFAQLLLIGERDVGSGLFAFGLFLVCAKLCTLRKHHVGDRHCLLGTAAADFGLGDIRLRTLCTEPCSIGQRGVCLGPFAIRLHPVLAILCLSRLDAICTWYFVIGLDSFHFGLCPTGFFPSCPQFLPPWPFHVRPRPFSSRQLLVRAFTCPTRLFGLRLGLLALRAITFHTKSCTY